MVTIHTRIIKKKEEHKDDSVVFTTQTGTGDDEEEVVPVTYVNNIIPSIFSNVEVYNQHLQFQWTLCTHVLHLQQL